MGFGGKTRSIHTKLDPTLKDKNFMVMSKRRVKTGTYSPGHYDEDGGDSPYLSNEKTHVLLSLTTYSMGELINCDAIEIEEKNVVKIPI